MYNLKSIDKMFKGKSNNINGKIRDGSSKDVEIDKNKVIERDPIMIKEADPINDFISFINKITNFIMGEG